ncbi:MAG: site-specific DNA-methyltransferase [Clostridia bacterium]|nr:site-specific DNA-methyltransferase [Clostridia bacterium]
MKKQYKKIVLDNSPIPCPSCMTTIQSGNSFPEMFLRSYECKNPSCPDRSKSGRGKRFDEFGIYRYCKLIENKYDNQISHDLYEKWRRDIFDESNDVYEMLIKYYTFGGETISIYPSCDNIENYNRKIIQWMPATQKYENCYKTYEKLPIVVLINSISSILNRKTGNRILTENNHLFNEDSSTGIRDLLQSQVSSAITSPPYYNAREYSQWETLIMYLIDMMINAASVYDTIENNGYYLYNIGDIVNNDNIYVNSMMSKRRLQLGFLSCMFFESVGFNLNGNIIWDKGQVQSKRNSTVNLNSCYVKCINCYEHIFILKKGNAQPDEYLSKVSRFSPVIKINSKGINTYKHTAPYPLEMVQLLKPFIPESNDKYILDPFVGSGTTVMWCKENNYKGVGFELNKEYYQLCVDKIFKKDLFN